MRRLFLLMGTLACFAVSFLQTTAATAQNYLQATGNPSFSVNVPVPNGFINIANGNLHLELSLSTLTQRGQLSLNERLVYDSRIWKIIQYNNYYWWPLNIPNSAAGWRFVKGNEAGSMVYNAVSSGSSPCDGSGGGVGDPQPILRGGGGGSSGGTSDYYSSSMTWTDPSGTAHTFDATYYQSDACDGTSSHSVSGGYATDASGYQVVDDGNGNPVVKDGNGTEVYPMVVDRFGNYFSPDNGSDLVDDMGRTPVITTQNGNQIYYDVLAPNGPISNNGTRVRYIVTMEQLALTTAFSQQDVVEYQNNGNPPGSNHPNISAIQSIQLPDGSSYQFSYDSYGEIQSVTLPTGGVVGYGWTNYLDSYQNVNHWVGSETLAGNTTTFTPAVISNCASNGTGCQEKMTMQRPSGDQTVYTLKLNNGAWNEQTAIYSGPASQNQMLRFMAATYDYSHPCSSNCTGAQFITKQTSTTTLADVGLNLTSQYSYPNANTGQLGSVKMWDYYSGSLPATPMTETDYEYSGVDISKETVKDGAGNQISQTRYNFANTPDAITQGLPGHNAALGAGPYLKSTDTWLNTSNTYLTTSQTVDDAGAVQSTTDPNGRTSFGHDGSDSFVTSTTLPTPSSGAILTSSEQVDPGTGLPWSATDANGTVQKVASYDPLSRPNELDSLDGQGNLVGKTTYAYYPTALVTYTYQNASVYTDSEVLYDGYGRTSRTAVSNGQSSTPWYQQDTCYNPNGAVSFVSYFYSGSGFGQSAVCSGAGDSYAYDALGRTTLVTHADGTNVRYTYTGRATMVTDENGVSRITQTDGLGRIAAVCEVSSNINMPASGSPTSCGLDIAGTGFLTQYTYDLPNHKTTITQGQQIRIFATDSLGRQTSVQEAEIGLPATFSYVYNSTGLVVTRVRPKANVYDQNPTQWTTTTSQYDSLSRLLSVSYDDNLTPTKTFNYDQPGNGGSIPNAGASKGRLTTMFNGGVHGRSYAYDALGRVTQTVECLADWCGQPQHDVFRYYGYDWQGNLTSDTYGTVGNAPYVNNGQSFATVSYGFNRADQLQSVTGGQNDASGTPNIYTADALLPYGPQHATYGNAVSTYSQYDSLNQLQGTWTCNGSGGYNCPNGGYIYGLYVQRTGSQLHSAIDTVLNRWTNFTYDDMGRLVGSSPPAANSGYTGLNFSASYDRYGNRWSESVSNTPSGVGPNQNLTFNPYNNQALYVPYDWAGNLIGDVAGHSYQYDAENNLISIDGGNTASFVYSALGEKN